MSLKRSPCAAGVAIAMVALWPLSVGAQMADMAATMAATSALAGAAIPEPPASLPAGAAGTPVSPAIPNGGNQPLPSIAGSEAATASVSGFSYGDAPYSLMFLKDQIVAMKSALRAYESLHPAGSQSESEPVEPLKFTPTVNVIPEPSTYPVFYLASVVYRAGNDWTVWVKQMPAAMAMNASVAGAAGAGAAALNTDSASKGGETKPSDARLLHITPKTNSGELRVVHVDTKHVKFAWKPSYITVIAQRYEGKKFAPMDKVKHRVANGHAVTYDSKQGAVSFVLKQNQSFSSAYFSCFEGSVDTVALAPFSGMSMEISTDKNRGGGAMTPAQAQDINNLLGTPATAGNGASAQPVPMPNNSGAPPAAMPTKP